VGTLLAEAAACGTEVLCVEWVHKRNFITTADYRHYFRHTFLLGRVKPGLCGDAIPCVRMSVGNINEMTVFQAVGLQSLILSSRSTRG
jgi:hypothetical protein